MCESRILIILRHLNWKDYYFLNSMHLQLDEYHFTLLDATIEFDENLITCCFKKSTAVSKNPQ